MRPCDICSAPSTVLIAPTIPSARYLCLPCALKTLNEEAPMANVDIVYEWTVDELLLGIDISGNPYCREDGAWMPVRAATIAHMLPALAALARIAETLGSVTWRADNVIDIDN